MFVPGVVEGDKTSVVFQTADKPGALEEVLRLFGKYGINISRIESKPPKFADSRFAFNLDFTGTPQDEHVRGTPCMCSCTNRCRADAPSCRRLLSMSVAVGGTGHQVPGRAARGVR